jgi:hypothetical protein
VIVHFLQAGVFAGLFCAGNIAKMDYIKNVDKSIPALVISCHLTNR